MNIVLAIQDLNVGGAERQLVELAIGLKTLGHDVRICCLNTPGDFAAIALKAGIPVDCLYKKYRYEVNIIFWLSSYLRRHKTDILQTYLFGADLWGRFAGRLAGVPAIVTSDRSGGKYKDWFELWSDRLFWPLADAVISNTEIGRKRIHDFAGIPMERMHTVGNGLAKERFANLPGKLDARTNLGVPLDNFVVVISGLMRPVKNTAMMMDVANSLCSAMPEVYFLIAGVGPCVPQMISFASEHKINDRVLFLGQRLDIPEILAASDVGILCSNWEGFPNSIMEYMAAGLPVVATDVGGVRELVKPELTGFLVPPSSAKEMTEKILVLKNDREKARQMGAAGRERVFEKCDFEQLARKTEDIYKNILKRKGCRA